MKTAFDAQIEALCRKFLERAARDAATLIEFSSRLDACKSSTRIEQVSRIAHGLSGAAGTFGFPIVSERASELDDLITAGASETALIHACRSLIVELQRISAAGTVRGSLRLTPKLDLETSSAAAEENSASERERPVVQPPPDRLTVMLLATVQEFVFLANTISDFGFNVVPGSVEPGFTMPEGISAVVISDRVDGWMPMSRVLSQAAPVLLISGDLGFHTRLAAVRVGVGGIIAHPLDPLELADWLDDIAGKAKESALTVLIIEDDALLAENYALVLRRAGMNVQIAHEAAEGLERLVACAPDLVLLDFQLPGVNGLDLARMVRQSRRDLWLPIVFVSAEKDPVLRLEARKQGGDDFVTKPVDPDELVSLVRLRAERAGALRSLMERDGLTGLLNHARFTDRLFSELERCRRTGAEVILAMFDLDRFKEVNDLYGHQSGDKVIRTLAHTLTAGLRRIDVVGRYGGEEFGVILLDTSPEAAAVVVDRLRQRFSETTFRSGEKDFNVTFSCGLASSNAHARLEDLVRAADGALYNAKGQGRNCIVIDGSHAETRRRSL
ncbi:MAG: diguanylate cyclase [Devosia sp.]